MASKKKKFLNKWKNAAETPEIAEICKIIEGGGEFTQAMADTIISRPTIVRRAMAFLGLKFELKITPSGYEFVPHHHAGGMSEKIIRMIKSFNEPPTVQKRMMKPTPTSPQALANWRNPPVVTITTTAASVPTKTKKTKSWLYPGSFYATEEWKRLRYDALKRFGAKCQCCGSSSATGAVINVDHIIPISRAPHRRSDPTNLQVLCSDCNWGKGSRDTTDWRYGNVQPIRNDGRSMTAPKIEESYP